MKRFLCLVLTLALMLALTGCGGLAETLHSLVEELRDMTDVCDWLPQDPGSGLSGIEDPSSAQTATKPAGGTWPGEEDTHVTAPVAQEDLLPLDGDCIHLTFSSGVGAWGTVLILYPDGRFAGDFSDSDMGAGEEEFPNGVKWECTFEGRFADITQLDAYTYKLTLQSLETEKPEGQEWIENGAKHIAAGAYGIEGGTEFYLYLPASPVEGLAEDVQMWWPDRFGTEDGIPTTLGRYGLCNAETGHTFFSARQ